MRTVLAVGVLAISVPVLAQPGRSAVERSRADRGGEARDGRVEKGGSRHGERRVDGQAERRGGGTIADRIVPRGGTPEAQPGRRDPRGEVPEAQPGRRDPWGGIPDVRYDRRDRRDESRVVVRAPVVINRYDHRAPRVVPRPYGHEFVYRYGDRDFRHRDVLTITTWFRSLPPARLAYYGYHDRYDRSWGGVRYVFRPGIYLSFDVFTHLAVLPYDLEYELGILPWYLERRIYGNTVLVIDTRTRYIVDIFEIDY
ncbi:MAG: hypothetical protein C0497_06725 [Gemmatimonas sp.]|nr:hypothetical protein [Gemmatimonas sp.]